jgi:hypothetical protein
MAHVGLTQRAFFEHARPVTGYQFVTQGMLIMNKQASEQPANKASNGILSRSTTFQHGIVSFTARQQNPGLDYHAY